MKNPYQFQIRSIPHRPFDWVVVDVETGGLDPTRHRLLSIGLWSIHRQDSFLVRDSDGSCEPQAMAINRISLDDVSTNGINRDEARQRFLDAIRGRAIVGHNVSFDLAFIASRLFGLGPYDPALRLFDGFNVYDTQRQFREQHPEAPSRLASVAEFYQIMINDDHLHRCEYDAELCGRVFEQEMLEVKDDRFYFD